MNLLPYNAYTIRTKLTREEILDLLQPEESKKWRWYARQHWRFSGALAGELELTWGGFKITRLNHYSYPIVVRGDFKKEKDSLEVKVRMYPYPLFIVIMCFLLGYTGLAAGNSTASVFKRPEFSPFYLIPLAVFLIGLLFFYGGFWIATKRVKAYLNNIFMSK